MRVEFYFSNNCGHDAYVHMSGPMSRESRVGYDKIPAHAKNHKIGYEATKGVLDEPDGNWTCFLAKAIPLDGPYDQATVHVDKCPNTASMHWNLAQNGNAHDGYPSFTDDPADVSYS